MGNDTTGISRREFLGAVAATTLAASYAGFALTADSAAAPKPVSQNGATMLSDGWSMQSSAVATEKGDAISSPGYAAGKWYPVSVPCTVLAGLVANGEYPDIFVGENLSKVPIDRFKVSWWYRRDFTLPAAAPGRKVSLYLKGICYRGNLWLNGKLIAEADQIVGTYRDFEVDITNAVGTSNVLAIEVFQPNPNKDLSITFVDWAPEPPDQNMGLWQDISILTSGPVTIRYPLVLTDLDVSTLATARLTVMADLTNTTDKSVTGRLTGKIGQVTFSQDVTLEPGKTQTLKFAPEAFSQLIISNPQIWWPWQLGNPVMQQLDLSFSVGEQESDAATLAFGIRKVTSRLDKNHRLFTVNGVDLLIVGGGYAPDLLQRRAKQEQHIRYLKDMNLNTVRLEGKLEDDAFYDLCDRYGVLVMAGWCCCSPWEKQKEWKDEQHHVAMESLRYQIRRARTHPSQLCWLNGSDNHPTAEIEKAYLDIEAELSWPNPLLSSATAAKAEMSEPTGVKMEGPYQWEPPIFWMTDTKTGGGWGFNTEVGPGPVPPPLETLEKMLPAEHRWPIDSYWDFHCGRESFGNINTFLHAQDERFGKSQNLADFSWKAQAQAYETIRAMYESFRRNKFDATGEIQWMLNNAWPSLIWHLYDYYLRPGGAYFATKLACLPVHVLYSYDNQSIVIANDTLKTCDNLSVTAEVYNIDASLKHKQAATLSAPANKSVVAFTLPAIADLSTAYFLRLTLRDADQKVIDTNSYYLSTKPDVMGKNGGKDSWNVTPVVSFADYTLIEKLPKVNLVLDGFGVKPDGEDQLATVKVTNTSASIAMMARLKITNGTGGEEILPIRWEDNYFMLLPNESRQITARYLAVDAKGSTPAISVDCFNNGRDS
jgi:exo-1,4-beta-D-glucosaminidase